jgi:hypothetical protein
MRKLSLIVALSALFFAAAAPKSDSPHGPDFKVPCDKCHSAKGWKLDKEIYSFDHNTTNMPLVGQHQVVDCRSCHISLVFSEAKTECIDCHTDMHNQTVGPDCGRCHTPKSWIVDDITGLHQRSRFPLLGAHFTASCNQCHPSASLLRFEPLGVECINCHQKDYNGANNPNHLQNNYSTNCTDCHTMTAFSWVGNINHDFFPLKEGHSGVDCFSCHAQGTYAGLSTECVSCHLANYNATTNPNHTTLGFSTTCNLCHTLAKGWRPANYSDHDAQFFPIYSGSHNGEWSMCTDCHPDPSNYMLFTCTNCHLQPETDGKHGEVGGYSYNDQACLSCHPTGSGEGSFNHNNSAFPLTGAHITTPCNQCHVTQYAGTPTGCPDCHIANYNATTNPNHAQISLPTTCSDCHTTNPGWKPASFTIHNTYYQLTGAHTTVDCNSCHNGQYSNTPNTCVGCHLDDYNQTNNPPHATAQFPTDCQSCHTTSIWVPSTFDHDGQYFPIYSGKHNGEWNLCSDCHPNPGNYAEFTCTTACHPQSEMNNEHDGVSGYSYNSNACLNCHPNGNAPQMARPRINPKHD